MISITSRIVTSASKRSTITSEERKFLEELSTKLCIGQEGWYSVSTSVIRKHGGGALLQKYNNSPSTLLTSVFPDYPWQTHKFARVPVRHWDDMSNQRAFMDTLAPKLNVTHMDDWYNLTCASLQQHGGGRLLAKHNNSLFKLLTKVFPEYPQAALPALHHQAQVGDISIYAAATRVLG